MKELELKVKAIGGLPQIGSYCLVLLENRYWVIGTWQYWEGNVILQVEEGEYPFGVITAWLELPNNIEDIK